MSLFTTTDEQKVRLYEIAATMHQEGFSVQFVADAVQMGEEYEGTYDLMVLWSEERDQAVKEEIIIATQEEIDQWRDLPKEPEKISLAFDDLESIARDVRAFKEKLRAEVDKAGGINQMAEVTGIPQPSLSRFFNSDSLPRSGTLRKIAEGFEKIELRTDVLSAWKLSRI